MEPCFQYFHALRPYSSLCFFFIHTSVLAFGFFLIRIFKALMEGDESNMREGIFECMSYLGNLPIFACTYARMHAYVASFSILTLRLIPCIPYFSHLIFLLKLNYFFNLWFLNQKSDSLDWDRSKKTKKLTFEKPP